MTPCVLADRTVLHIKLVPTDCSMVYLPRPDIASHISLAKWTPVNDAFFFNNTILNRKFVPTDCSMVYLPRPDIASHISLAKWTPVNDAFLFNNSILNRKFVPTDCSMVYLPCRHVASCMPIASGTNVVILFRTGAFFPDLEIVTACAAVIDLACSYSTVYRLLAMRTHVVENLAFGHGFCCLRWPHRPLPSVAVVLLAMYLCRPLCGHFCSVLLSALFCLRLCFLPLGALLFSLPLSFRDGIPDIGDGACLFFFRCPPRHFRLRCRYPLYRFADASPGNGALPAVATDLVTITRTMLRQPRFKSARCLLYLADAASPPAPCFSRTI